MKIIPAPWNIFGIIFILLGVYFELAADRLFHLTGTTVTPFEESRALVTGGVFRASRNPMYLGFALILFGTLSPFLVVPVFGILLEMLFIRPEEKMLAQRFGKAYLEYQ